ncbi:MAG: transcriptional regulator, Crp/Fnr family [Gemmatimonadetes bacterium]|nr:transcriptional regulator, Crp/Fnr family [Gemmatimonadota bacterium]
MIEHSARKNRILASLSPDSLERVLSLGEPYELSLRELVYEPGVHVSHVHFPLTAVISIITVSEGRGVEVATVGNEGMAGLPVFLGGQSMPARAIAQVPGKSIRLSAAGLEDAVNGDIGLRLMLGKYTQALLTQISQSAACNRLHDVESRCARWLLMTDDRVDGNEFVITHEFLAQMLGVRRASVSNAAGVLQKRGLIRYSRGRVSVTNREGLEDVSCVCYDITRSEYDRLLSPAMIA